VKKKTKFVFDSNIPCYQYYLTGQFINYDYKQLNSLPKFPFLNDIQSYNRSSLLSIINPMNLINKK